MKSIYSQTNLIAHRGHGGKYLENTLPAFISACKKDFFGIETDIQFTRDNKIVCFHDKTLKRLIGENIKLSSLTYREISKRKFLNQKTKICKFKNYLRTCKKHKKICIIEIKYKASNRQLDILISKLKWRRYLQNCIIISFNRDILIYLRNREPNLRLQLLVNSPIKRYVAFCKRYNTDVSLNEYIVKHDTISKLNALGIKVGVWTINNKNTAQKFIDQGASYITTDIFY